MIQAISAPLYLPSSKFVKEGTNRASKEMRTSRTNGVAVFNVTLFILKIVLVNKMLTRTKISCKLKQNRIKSYIIIKLICIIYKH